MVILLASIVSVGVIAFLLVVRPKDLPHTPPSSPFAHLDERKASIYENLRDLQFEYRLGKMSDEDYQRSKADLQRELAKVLAEVERIAQGQPEPVTVRAQPAEAKKKRFICPNCNAQFAQTLKFCGECGKPMKGQG